MGRRAVPRRADARRRSRRRARRTATDARAIFVARGRARDGTVRVPRARRVPRETDESRLVVHAYVVDRSRLVSLEGDAPRSRDVRGASRDRASSSIAHIDRTKREKTRIEHRKTTNHASRARRRPRRRSIDRSRRLFDRRARYRRRPRRARRRPTDARRERGRTSAHHHGRRRGIERCLLYTSPSPQD